MPKHLFKALMTLVILCSPLLACAQGMSINTTGSTADHSAMLDIASTSQGMLVPRMLSTERAGISLPATGLLVYQTDGTSGFYYNSGTPLAPVWTSLSATTAAGSLTGTTLAGNVVNASISTLSALTGNGVVTTSGGIGALGVTGTTGAGSVVLATSPALISPNLGTIASGNGAALTGLQNIANSSTAGNSVAMALGSATLGTTGSGNVVLAASPILVTPALGTPSALVGTNITGLASSLTAGKATVLATARTINGTSFDGSANITVTAAAATLTGTALPALDGSALTNIIPSQTGNSGKYLTTNGATASWATVSGGGTSVTYITTSTTAAPANGVNTFIYCTASGVVITLPTLPTVGQTIYMFTDSNTGTIDAGTIGIRQSGATFTGLSGFNDINLNVLLGKTLIYNGAFWMTF